MHCICIVCGVFGNSSGVLVKLVEYDFQLKIMLSKNSIESEETAKLLLYIT